MLVNGVDRFLIDIGNFFCFSGAVTCWSFCLYYWYLAKWWKSESGAHLMALTGGMALILTYVSWRIIWPAIIPTRTDFIVRALIFGAEAFLAGWRFSILVRKQTKARSKRGQIGKTRQGGNKSGGRHSV